MVLRILRNVALGLLVVVCLAAAALFVASSRARARIYDVRATPLRVAAAGDGARIARGFACRECHGPAGQGHVMIDDPMLGRVVAPSLARAAALYSDAELERVIRHGVKRDGTGVLVMPSPSFGHMADEDVAAIIGWLRTLRPGPADETATTRLGPVGRLLLATGKLSPEITPDSVVAPIHRPADLGRYLYQTSCAACHDLARPKVMGTGETTPALAAMGASYDDAAFANLLRTGKGVGDRELGTMSKVARGALSSLDEREITAIHDYLRREAAGPDR